MTITSIDATGLSPAQITALAKAGVKTVGRYLAHTEWKALNVGEVANLKAAGMQIFSVYESNPTKVSYFSAAKGKSDALDAIALAKAVGQPLGSAIYFTVDYDAKSTDLPVILAYFKAIQANLTGYKVGAYGSYTVLNYLHQNNAADYWFQTVAWSNGQHCNFLNIYQFQCDKTLAGVNVDYNNLEKSDIGAWGQVVQVKKAVAKPAVAKPVGKPPDYPGKPLRKGTGDKGHVKLVQTKLHITADGIFGNGTEKAIKNFQSHNHLTADGIIGPKTWAKMF